MTKILIVDDTRFARRIVRKLIEDDATQILEADNGVQAIEIIAQEKPDAVILDLNMPDMNGFDVLEKLNERDLNNNILILTADIQKTTKEKCLNLGAADVLYKPITDTMLKDRINTLLSVG